MLVFAFTYQSRYFGIGIIEIAPKASSARTKHHTSWRLTLRNSLIAEGAFLNSMPLMGRNLSIASRKVEHILWLIPIERAYTSIRTCGHAHTTANALFIILTNDSRFGIFIRGPHGTHFNARWIFTVLAWHRHNANSPIRILSSKRLDARTAIGQNSIPEHPLRNIVRRLASNLTRMTRHTSACIYNHSTAHANPPHTSPLRKECRNSNCYTLRESYSLK